MLPDAEIISGLDGYVSPPWTPEMLVRSAQRFYFDTKLCDYVFSDAAMDAMRAKLFRLPFRICRYEWLEPTTDGQSSNCYMSCTAWEMGAPYKPAYTIGIILFPIVAGSKRIPIGFQYEYDPDKESLHYWPATYNEETRHPDDFPSHWMARVTGLTMALNSKDVETRDVVPTRQQRRHAERKGLAPEAVYKTVVLSPRVRHERKAVVSVDLRASPKLHWRRGHTRTLPSGKETFVSPCLVGSIASGTVDKEYAVR